MGRLFSLIHSWHFALMIAASVFFSIVQAATPESGDFKVTLLGTSSPLPNPERFGPSTLVEAGDLKLLVDGGRGATIRLGQIGIPIGKIDALFLTHFHSDHTAGVPDLWLTGWLSSKYGSRTEPFHLIGPKGSRAFMDGLKKAYEIDIKTRLEDEKLPPKGIATVVDEFEKDGVVFEKSGVKVIAFRVLHGEKIKPSFGYRIEYKGRVAVISGDTKFDENVIKNAKGADLLVHEVCAAKPEVLKDPAKQKIMAHHTSPKEAGLVFAKANVKLAAFTHIVRLGNEVIPPLTIDELIAETRQTYSGPLEVGEDLMAFSITDQVTVHRPNQPTPKTLR